MSKFYKIIKDHPVWEVGTILELRDGRYYPIDDLYVKDIKGVNSDWCEGSDLIENQPEWFERVYKVNVLKQAKYLAKDAARKVHEELYKA